ncbi:aminodeoxychorismate synthase component I [Agitococcus lubricus]|uniref:Para-aminobenzoate synthetase component 1 n=1 Tax=Agitococcus lubricus TaxID=1077255 RepID=A0A2T5J021_9GAMM|nr:aminodeoxychorismate synthase component I [Agitococcus lubricus]PTQ89589.1 para-aminobenzoate synthetase component 1 [Agitococcus lubricus]
MFAFSLPAHVSTHLPFLAFSPLLQQAAWWPMWLKDADAWCLAVLPKWLVVEHDDGCYQWLRQADLSYRKVKLDTELASHVIRLSSQEVLPTITPTCTEGFSGGLMGWLGYDYQQQPAAHQELVSFPVLCFGFYDTFIRPNHHNQPTLYSAEARIGQTVLAILSTPPPSAHTDFRLDSAFVPLMSRAQYEHAFDKVEGYLRSGDCYQVNLAQGFKASCQGVAISAFDALLKLSQAPFACYSHSPYGEILSVSPELFLAFQADGTVLTRPIKGTRPRHDTPELDEAQRHDLATHPKDKAENLMIVDLLRNDLAKHARIGSVQVPTLFKVESFPQVHHLISTIRCQLAEDTHPLTLLFDAFPGGSITGAPKKRAMEIIQELENCQRSIYCGSIGYLSTGGRGRWNIAIRTLLRVNHTIYAWAGGGIVADSVCESEYQECFNKIGAILRCLEDTFWVKDKH